MTPSRMARLGIAAVALGGMFVAGAVHLLGDARSELAASDAAWKSGDAVAAAVHARAAARAYVPGAAHMQLGYERLREVAEVSERKGDVESALFAWRAVLSAANATRPFSTTPEACSIAESSISRLSAALVASGRSPSAARRTPSMEPGVDADVGRSAWWGVLLLGGAALWYAAGVRLATKGWGRDGRLVALEVRLSAAMALAGLVAWVTGLLLG